MQILTKITRCGQETNFTNPQHPPVREGSLRRHQRQHEDGALAYSLRQTESREPGAADDAHQPTGTHCFCRTARLSGSSLFFPSFINHSVRRCSENILKFGHRRNQSQTTVTNACVNNVGISCPRLRVRPNTQDVDEDVHVSFWCLVELFLGE